MGVGAEAGDCFQETAPQPQRLMPPAPSPWHVTRSTDHVGIKPGTGDWALVRVGAVKLFVCAYCVDVRVYLACVRARVCDG